MRLSLAAAVVGLGLCLTGLSGCNSDGGASGSQPGAPGAAGDPAVSSDHLDACAVVTTRLLHDDLGLDLTAAGQSSPSFYGDAEASDCGWFVGGTTVSAFATDRAALDLPEGAIDGFLQSGGAAVPGADRGVALATSNADGSNIDLIVVKGQLGIELAASSSTPMTQAQALALGQHVAGALG